MKNIDLTGSRNGKLVFLQKVYHDSCAKWLVRCDCGREYLIRGGKPRSSMCRSCASSLPRYGKRTGHGDITGTRWGHIKKNAQERGILFDVTIEQAWEKFLFQNRKCALSGFDLVFSPHGKENFASQTASLDRINSSKGYTIDNVQWVHQTVNFIKHTLTTEQLIEWCRSILDHSSVSVADRQVSVI